MENLHLPMVLLPFFLLHFLSLLLLSSANYTEYFINCGSKSNITVGDRNFVGDLNAGSFSVGKSSNVSATNSATDMSLYQTARIFENPSSYEFDIIDYGIYNVTYVRLHFFPLISGKTNLADALFNVSTSNFSLLSNFGIKNNSNSPLIVEFLLTINESKFSIHFTPHRKSFAFVSAIEVFLILDKDFVMNHIPLVTPAGSSGTFIDVRSQVLRTIHRVNIGGTQNNDTLWRTWIPDDDYLLSRGSAKICPSYNGTLKYDVLGATSYSASDLVYRTCKQLNSNSSNITWGFHVNKNARHLVRLHFCDIVSVGADVAIRFNLLIYSNFSHEVYPNDRNGTEQLAAPFYYDFVVDSDDSGVMNVGVGTKSAYLNGVEIMEFTKESDVVPIHGKPKKGGVVVIVATACGAVFVFVLVVLFLLWRFRYKKAKHVDGVGSLPVLHGKRSPYRKGTTANPSPVRNVNLNLKMPLLEILGATHNFDTKLLIGEGGFGKVYKGTLSDGTKVAVKRSDSKHGQGLPEFETEILVLSKIRHRHLVSLKGYCEEGSEMILVYEFIEKGTLRDHLYHLKEIPDQRSSKRSKLSWKQRLEICIGSAKGLHYLHTSSAGGIIHRDVKSTNILLNEHYVAKVADFGLSRSGPHDPNNFSTVGIKGSFGYVDPEYFRSFEFTEKSDVYSFGVVLLEVLCARPAIIDSPKREEVNLAEWGMFWQKKGQLERIIDPLLVGEINPDSLRKFGQTTEKCLKDDGADRPSMLDVQWDLEYALQLQQIALNKEPHDDTTTNAFLELHVPSDSVPDWEEDHVPILLGDNGSETINSEVFSQMRIDGAR